MNKYQLDMANEFYRDANGASEVCDMLTNVIDNNLTVLVCAGEGESGMIPRGIAVRLLAMMREDRDKKQRIFEAYKAM